MKNNDKKKKELIKKILVILLIIVLFIIMLIIILNKHKQNQREYQEKIEQQQVVKEYLEEKVIPQGVSLLVSNYNGNVTRDELYTRLNELVSYFPDLYDEINGLTEYNKYYLTNKNDIEKYLGITNQEEFEEFVKYIAKIRFIKSDFEYAKIEKDSYESLEKRLKFKIGLKYLDNEMIYFNVYLAFNKMQSENPVSFSEVK